MRWRFALLCFFIVSEKGFSDFTFESTPWTKSYLETTCSCFFERVNPHYRVKKQYFRHANTQGKILLSSAIHPEWQVDIAAFVGSIKEKKIAARVERLLLSDLTGSPFALSCFVSVAKAQESRVKTPAFFEMAQNACEVGLGVGRHIHIGKNSYTQLFSYFVGGVGKRAAWTQVEIGTYHSFYHNHALRCSLSRTESLQHHAFNGFGSIRTSINDLSLQYIYRLKRGMVSFTFSERVMRSGPLKSAQICQIGFTYPIAL